MELQVYLFLNSFFTCLLGWMKETWAQQSNTAVHASFTNWILCGFVQICTAACSITLMAHRVMHWPLRTPTFQITYTQHVTAYDDSDVLHAHSELLDCFL